MTTKVKIINTGANHVSVKAGADKFILVPYATIEVIVHKHQEIQVSEIESEVTTFDEPPPPPPPPSGGGPGEGNGPP